MGGAKITRQRDGVKWSARNNSPKTGELNGQHEITRQRMESKIK